jgi:hypothetical protein
MNLNGLVLALCAKVGTSSRLIFFRGGTGVDATLDMTLALLFNADCIVAGGLGRGGREEWVD